MKIKARCKNIIKSLSRIACISAAFIGLWSATLPTTYAGSMFGYVYTRSLVTNDNGDFIWGEYDPQDGKYLKDLADATGDWDPQLWRVMSGEEFLSFVKLYENLKDQYDDLDAPMSRAEYESTTFLLADGATQFNNKPNLARNTAYVSVLPQNRRLLDDAGSLVLGEYPINPSQSSGVSPSTLSLLVKYDGDNRGGSKGGYR